ncbi:MAG TPA: hypothetical protein VMU30_10295 [Bacteroidota bacterium]|nr:hypothetical protein [Bacteroidota bacterium]
MMKNKILFFALGILPFAVFAQPAPDAVVIVNQSTLNGFFDAIGPVSGTEPYNVLGMHGDYTWTVEHAHIDLKPDQALFMADAHIKIGGFSYGSTAKGDVEVKYHPETNRISVKVLKATFEVALSIFGKKIHIADVDVSKFYRPEFEFAGPQPVQAKVEVALPGDKKKMVYITPFGQLMKVEKERIVVTSQLKFSDQPPGQ